MTQAIVRQERMAYWGYKFEQLCTGGDGGAPVDANAEFCSIVSLSIGDRVRLVMAAEVDCAEGAAAGGAALPCVARPNLRGAVSQRCIVGGCRYRYVELKTSRRCESGRQEENFERRRLSTGSDAWRRRMPLLCDEMRWWMRWRAHRRDAIRRAPLGTSCSSFGCSPSSPTCRASSWAGATTPGSCSGCKTSRPRPCTGRRAQLAMRTGRERVGRRALHACLQK